MNQQQPLTSLSCAEFQDHLPELFANANGTPDDPALQAHLDTCENCSALVRDLQYIADQARILLEPDEEEPSDALWGRINETLESERADASSAALPPVS